MKQKLVLILICLLGISNVYAQVSVSPGKNADQYLSGENRILSQSFPRKVVMEECTGTWCPWCVRGVVGVAMMKEKYPDTFIGIAVHGGHLDEPMLVADYANYMKRFTSGYPSSMIDRKLRGDPSFDVADNLYRLEAARPPIAGIRLTGGFIDNNKQMIILKATTTFGLSFNNANFKLAYVLIENGVTGYGQYNGYAGGESGPMGGYENKPAYIADMVFDDVARGIYSDPAGIGGSIPASITEMVPVEHSLIINLPSTIQNKNQLEVVVLLLNAGTEEIENADKTAITGIFSSFDVPATGISLDKSSCTLAVGGAEQLTASVVPANATINAAVWKSSNPSVAAVSASGLVTAVGNGTATITATTHNGIAVAACALTTVAANPDFEVINGVLTAYHGTGGDVVIPGNLGIISIGYQAFYEYSGLTSVTISNSVTSIDNYAFDRCYDLTSVTIPNSVTSIGSGAFHYCYRLTSVTIPNSVISIGSEAFSGCDGLTSVTIPNSVTSIGTRAFSGRGITAIEVDKANPSYTSETGVLFDKGEKTLISFPAGKPGAYSYIIPNSVTSIGDYAFFYCYRLTSITIPNSVTSIGDDAFYSCSGLTSVTIPNSVTSIGDNAFYSCSGLTSMTIPNSVTSIGSGAFSGCSGITAFEVDKVNPSFTSETGVLFDKGEKTLVYFPAGKPGTYSYIIPNSVTSIGDYAFYSCKGLTSVTIPNSVTSFGLLTFSYCSGLTSVTCYAAKPPSITIYPFMYIDLQLCTLYVPKGSKALYEAAEVWKDFGTITEGASETGIALNQTPVAANVYISNRNLIIQSDASETIDIYTVSGVKIYTAAKNSETISIPCSRLPEGIRIIKGSSGWVKKIMY